MRKILILIVLVSLVGLVPVASLANTYFDESLRLEKAGRYMESYEVWQQGRTYVADGVFYQRLGWLCFLMGDYGAGRLNYLNAIKADPTDVTSALGLMNCLSAEKRYKEACNYGNYLFKMLPSNEAVLNAYSKALYECGRYAEQIRLAQLHPQNRVLNSTRGWSLFQQGKYSKSRKMFLDLLPGSKTEQESAILKNAIQTAERGSQAQVGFFYTPINYGASLPDKIVKNAAVLYSPDKWTQLRFIYGSTETSDDTFNENSFSLGFSKLFDRKNSLSFDFLHFNNDDALTDNGNVFSLQFGRQTGKNIWLFMEADYSSFTAANAVQLSPRVLWTFSARNSLEFKTYLTRYSRNPYFSGNNIAGRLKFTRYLTKDLNFSSFVWTGRKRLSYESDKSYSYNALDRYTGGFGLEFGYTLNDSFDLKLGYAQNRFESYSQSGISKYAGQWTLGLTIKD